MYLLTIFCEQAAVYMAHNNYYHLWELESDYITVNYVIYVVLTLLL